MLEGSKIVSELIGKGVNVNVLNIGLMVNTPSSKFAFLFKLYLNFIVVSLVI
jgi:hypothetical protein